MSADLTTAVVPPAERSTAAPAWRRVLAQGLFEARATLRNGEQLLVTILLPVVALVALARTGAVTIETDGARRIDVIAPGVLALAVLSTSFTSQAIATSFDRRNGVLRLLATTPLGRGGLLAGKILAVAMVELVQIVLLGCTAAALGWRPALGGIPLALVAVAAGTAAFTSLALLVAGTLRSEAVLAGANLLFVAFAVAGGVLVPVGQLPTPLAHLVAALPSGALGEALRGALQHATVPGWSLPVLLAWTVVLGWAAARSFRWH